MWQVTQWIEETNRYVVEIDEKSYALKPKHLALASEVGFDSESIANRSKEITEQMKPVAHALKQSKYVNHVWFGFIPYSINYQTGQTLFGVYV